MRASKQRYVKVLKWRLQSETFIMKWEVAVPDFCGTDVIINPLRNMVNIILKQSKTTIKFDKLIINYWINWKKMILTSKDGEELIFSVGSTLDVRFWRLKSIRGSTLDIRFWRLKSIRGSTFDIKFWRLKAIRGSTFDVRFWRLKLVHSPHIDVAQVNPTLSL